MRPVVAVVGRVLESLPEFELVAYRPGVAADVLLIVPGETRPEELPEWLPVVEEVSAKVIREAVGRWRVTITDVEEIPGPGTVVFGRLDGARLRDGELATREGHPRSMRIREIRVNRERVMSVDPGREVALAFGPVPKDLFRRGFRLRPGKAAVEKPRESIHSDVKDAILQAVGDEPIGRGTTAICKMLDRTPQQLGDIFESLRKAGQLHGFAGQWIKPAAFDRGVEQFIQALEDFHKRYPGRPSHPVDKVLGAARLGWSGKPLDRILARMVQKGAIAMREEEIRRPAFRVLLGDRQRALLDRITSMLDGEGVNTPNAHEIGKRLPAPAQAVNEILSLGEDVGEIVTLADGVIFTTKGLAEIRARVREGSNGKSFTLGEMRDSLGTNRRVAVALLEQFDLEGFTERQGEERIVKPV